MYGLDLFSGIGGLTEALDGYSRPVAYCENDRHATGVLLSRMARGDLPRAPIWDDVKTLTAEMLPPVDIVYGGFPCQDISVAGRGKGLGGERSGLFFEVVRIVGDIRPRFVFLENVAAITIRGSERVVGELCKLGYDTRWGLLSASDVGANHQRERWWLLAHAPRDGRHGRSSQASSTGRLGIERQTISIKRVGQSMADARLLRPTGAELQAARIIKPGEEVADPDRRAVPLSGGDRKNEMGLDRMAKMWPTPRAEERGKYQRDRGQKGKERLTLTGEAEMWPTPTGTQRGDCPSERKRRTPNLTSHVVWRTPNATDGKNRGTAEYRQGKQIQLQTQVGGQLNPTWVEWLMGYPCGWTVLEDWVTPWFRLRRAKRSKD